MNLKINHRLGVVDIKYFNNFSVTLKHDSIASTFAFRMYFDPKNKDHAEALCVSHFHEAIIEHNKEKLITGYILTNNFKHNKEKQLVEIAGYSKPGVFEDCQIPPDLYPLEKSGLSIRTIAQQFIDHFHLKIKIIVDPEVADVVNAAIEKTTANESQSIKDYLTELAIQRHIIMTHDEDGNLVFTREKIKRTPIAHFEMGEPVTELGLNFNGQPIHSHIYVVKQADDEGGNAGQAVIRNPYCPIVKRYKVVTQSSGTDVSTEEYARQLLAEELKNIKFTILIDRWDINQKIIRPRNVISIKSPEIYLYNKTNLFVEEVEYTGDQEKMTARLTCVPEEVYNNEIVKNIFVDAHENFPRVFK